MPIRTLLRYLINNEQLIQKLAESYPIRRAAQLTAYLMHRGKDAGQESIEQLQGSAKRSGKRLSNFTGTFTKELEEGFKEMKEDMKKKR